MIKPNKDISIRKMRWMLCLLGFFKIPLVGFIKPKLISIDENKVCVKIKLRRRTKNHLNSMYFGALAVGADIAGGIHVFYFAEQSNLKVSFAFKGMKADFIKRAESDIIFESNQGEIVRNAINLSAETGERVNETINVIALDENQEIAATFEMIVSVKVATSMS